MKAFSHQLIDQEEMITHHSVCLSSQEAAAAASARRPRVSFADGVDSDDEGKGDGPKKSRAERIAEAQVGVCVC